MTPQEREKIALWMGRTITHFEATSTTEWPSTKTSLTDAECIEVLNRLVEKGFYYALWSGRDMVVNCKMVGVDIGHPNIRDFDYTDLTDDPNCFHGFEPTIHEAVEQALSKLIAAERGKE